MLLIDNDIVSQLLTMDDCIRVQEEAFRQLPNGGAIHRPRIDMYVPAEREDGYFRWGTMEGANDGYFAIRMKSDIITWPRDESGNWTEEKYCREPGTYCGLIFLFSTRNAEPLAFINDGVLQHFRVGGGAGIGVKYLSREDSRAVGMLGSGGMARAFLEAFKCVRDIKLCKVFSPTAGNREAFAREMSQRLGIEVRAMPPEPSMPTTWASARARYLAPMPAPPPTRMCCSTPSLMKASGSALRVETSRMSPQ